MLGLGYGYLVAFRPFSGLLTPALAVLFGSLIGLAASRALAYCKVRSDWVARAVTFTAATIGLYVAWAAWITAVVRALGMRSGLAEFFLPGRLAEAVLAVDRAGHWKLLALRPAGWTLALLWVAEAAVVYAAALVMAESQLNEHGFCEGCGAWTEYHPGVARLPEAEFLDFRRHLEEHDLGYLASLGEVEAGAASWTSLDLHACRCGALNLLDARVVTRRGKPGAGRESQRMLFAKLILRSEEARAIRALSARQQQATVRARAAAAATLVSK